MHIGVPKWDKACGKDAKRPELEALTGIPLYLLAVILAFVSVTASVATCMLLAVFFAVTGAMHHILVVKKTWKAG